MTAAIQVDKMTRAERDRLAQAISGNGSNGQQPDAEQQNEEGYWESYIPWYVRPMQVLVYVFAYTMLGLGWLVTHIGVGLTWLGHEAKDAARNID